MIWFVILAWYLGVGFINLLCAWGAGRLTRNVPGAWIEKVFYVLLWPVQLAFWMLVQISNAAEFVLGRIMGGQ